MKTEDTGAIRITMDEFCKGIGIPKDNWIFENMPTVPLFYKYGSVRNREVTEPERYFFNNGKVIREFKYMKDYGETWIRIFDMTDEQPHWSIWTTWSAKER